MTTLDQIQEFEQAINSDNFLYARKWRISQYADDYSIVAYCKDDISVNGKSAYAMLPLKEGLEILEKNGKDKPLGSIV